MLFVKFFALGAAIGAATGIPIGPVNVAVIESAYHHNLRRAIAVGLGGGLADFIYSFLGVTGVGPFIREHESLQYVLYFVSGIVLIAYGAITLRTQPSDISESTVPRTRQPSKVITGFFVGMALILLNPAAIITWVVIVGSLLADAGAGAMEGTATAIGIGVGSFGWFTFVAFMADKGKRVLGERIVTVVRLIAFALIAYGVFLVGRAAYYAYGQL